MPKWLVRLKGDTFDLEDLPALLRSPELTITEENGSYYLESSEFDSLTYADEVRERSVALIKMINGAAKLYRDNFRGISEDGVIRIEDNGRRHHYIFAEAVLTARSKLSTNVTVTTSDGTQVTVNQPSVIETWLGLAKKYKPVADVLHFSRENTWFNLYKIFEVIRDDVRGEQIIVKNGWVSDKKLSQFTQTAQSREALGYYARHASKKYRSPTPPMSWAEAKSLIKGLIMNWLCTKS